MLASHKRMIDRYFNSTDANAPGLLILALNNFEVEYYGEVRLIVSIMETGLIDLDYDYILDGGLQLDCAVLELDYKAVKAAFVGMAELIKLNKEWRG